MGLFHNIVAGLGGNNETSYARDASGQMQTTQTPSTPGQQWKHILAGALTGLAAGAQTHSPGAPVLSGLGAGFSAETQDLRNQDLLKRQQADRDFQDRQEATRNADTHTLQQAQLAHQNLENAKLTHDANLQSTFDANKMAESSALLQEHNLKMEKDAKDLGLINPRNITSYSQLSDQDNQDIAQNKKKFITGLNGGGTLYDRTKDPTTTPNESAYDVVKWGVDDKGKPVKKVLGHVNAGAGTMFQQEAAMQQETTTFADTHGKDVERRLKESEITKNHAEAGKFNSEATKVKAANSAIENAAQSLASGDLTRLRDISSYRNEDRLLIYNRAKELNPKFNTAEVDRKIKMEDSFTNGKDGQNLQSLGTLVQHAGEASDVVNSIRDSSSPAINKSMKWWQQNMSGDPAYRQLTTALEPVKKEYEGYLLGGRALYGDDRKAADTILSDTSSPAQIQAALKQLGTTVKQRFDESNFRYKRVMGHDLQDAISPEAQTAGQKLGVDFGGQSSPAQSTAPQGQPVYHNGQLVGHTTDGKTMIPLK